MGIRESNRTILLMVQPLSHEYVYEMLVFE